MINKHRPVNKWKPFKIQRTAKVLKVDEILQTLYPDLHQELKQREKDRIKNKLI